MHRENSAQILGEYPFCVWFDGEKAVNTVGVCRDIYFSFWESAHLKHFDGENNLLISAINPQHSHVHVVTARDNFSTQLHSGELSANTRGISVSHCVM